MPNLFASSEAGAAGPPVASIGGAPVAFDGAIFCPCGEKSVLLAPPAVPILVNGRPVPAGIRVLAHRDHIRTASGAWWFSAEGAPRVAPFPGGENDLCPRCRQHIGPAAAAVRCPCGAWFHQSSELPCFAYAPACPVCRRPTVLDAAVAFSPGE
jgi:hypothetical protein